MISIWLLLNEDNFWLKTSLIQIYTIDNYGSTTLMFTELKSTVCVCVLPGSFRGMRAFYFKIEIEETSLTQNC